MYIQKAILVILLSLLVLLSFLKQHVDNCDITNSGETLKAYIYICRDPLSEECNYSGFSGLCIRMGHLSGTGMV